MNTDDYSQHSMDGPEEPYMWGDTPNSICDSDSSCAASGENAKNKNKFIETTSTDKGYFCIKERVRNRKVRIEGYSTPTIPGNPIRNAVTGYYEVNYMGKATARVGACDEDRFFKVSLAINGISSDTRTLFYDSPSQYERHFNTPLSPAHVSRWNEKQARVNASARVIEATA